MAITDIKEYAHLTAEDVEELGRELDQIRSDIEESRGERDAQYIRKTIQLQRGWRPAGASRCSRARTSSRGRRVPPCSVRRRSSRTWSWGTTSLTVNGTG